MFSLSVSIRVKWALDSASLPLEDKSYSMVWKELMNIVSLPGEVADDNPREISLTRELWFPRLPAGIRAVLMDTDNNTMKELINHVDTLLNTSWVSPQIAAVCKVKVDKNSINAISHQAPPPYPMTKGGTIHTWCH